MLPNSPTGCMYYGVQLCVIPACVYYDRRRRVAPDLAAKLGHTERKTPEGAQGEQMDEL